MSHEVFKPYSPKKTFNKTITRVGIVVAAGALTGITASIASPEMAEALKETPWVLLLIPAVQGAIEALQDWLRHKN